MNENILLIYSFVTAYFQKVKNIYVAILELTMYNVFISNYTYAMHVYKNI